jgi:hypothetical protein
VRGLIRLYTGVHNDPKVLEMRWCLHVAVDWRRSQGTTSWIPSWRSPDLHLISVKYVVTNMYTNKIKSFVSIWKQTLPGKKEI